MLELLDKIKEALDDVTGIKGTFGYVIVIVFVVVGHSWINSSPDRSKGAPVTNDDDEEEEVEPPRNFTLKQLLYFDGKVDEKTDKPKPVYLSLNGIVFDVSKGKDFYGPGGPYEQFAGHECGVALAKMSFETNLLDDVDGCTDDKTLNFGERDELNNWIDKFTHYRCYPVKGKLIPETKMPNPTRIISKEELAGTNGSPDNKIPDGYATQPIYIGVGYKVYDASFGGVTFYGPNTAYEKFAGKNVSRALAKMSFDPADLENTDTSDLNDSQIKVLNDWIKTFEERKGYPVVGRLN